MTTPWADYDDMAGVLTESPALEDVDLLASARALGLNEQRFVRDLVERVHAPKVRADFLGGVRSGVNGTPTFFINGVRHNGSFEYPVLLGAVKEAARAGSSRR